MLRSTCTRKSEFPSSKSEVSGGTTPEVRFPTRKVGRISQRRHRNTRRLLRASTALPSIYVIKSAVHTVLSNLYLWTCVAAVFVCAKCRVIRCYQLVLRTTTANLAGTNPSTTKGFLEASILVFELTGTRVNSGVTSFPAPTSEVNVTQRRTQLTWVCPMRDSSLLAVPGEVTSSPAPRCTSSKHTHARTHTHSEANNLLCHVLFFSPFLNRISELAKCLM